MIYNVYIGGNLMNFKNLQELKQRIKPAIQAKLNELKTKNITIISENDIWEYLKTSWKNANGLTLYDIINDIMNINEEQLKQFSIRRKNNDKSN